MDGRNGRTDSQILVTAPSALLTSSSVSVFLLPVIGVEVFHIYHYSFLVYLVHCLNVWLVHQHLLVSQCPIGSQHGHPSQPLEVCPTVILEFPVQTWHRCIFLHYASYLVVKSKHNLFSKGMQKEVWDGRQRMCERKVGSLVPQDG